MKFCQVTPYKKVIEQTAGGAADLCTSSTFVDCAAFKVQRRPASTPPCPFLHESRAQVCSHDPAVRLVPCSDNVLPRCSTENHHYCDIYLGATHRTALGAEIRGNFTPDHPSHFCFSHNHMWLDVSSDGNCHVGLDALLTRMLGPVDKLSFVTNEGEQCPSVVLTVHGVNLHLIFPNPMRITSANTQVRVDPDRLIVDPYGAGWLFEGTVPAGSDIRTGLHSGNEAKLWLEHEHRRIAGLARRHLSSKGDEIGLLAADGGVLVEGAVRHMKRSEIYQFFDELFLNEEVL